MTAQTEPDAVLSSWLPRWRPRRAIATMQGLRAGLRAPMTAAAAADRPAPAPAAGTLARAARARLGAQVSIQSLAVFRILFGALLVWDYVRFVQYDRIARYYAIPEFTFTYPGFRWVQPLPEPWLHLAWGVVGLSSLCVMLGLFYRVAIVVLTLSFSYFFLLDKAQYLNHFYMVILYALIMCALPAHRAFSLDALRRPELRSETVPYAAVFILRA